MFDIEAARRGFVLFLDRSIIPADHQARVAIETLCDLATIGQVALNTPGIEPNSSVLAIAIEAYRKKWVDKT